METIDFGISKGLYATGLKGTLEDFSSDTLHVHPFHQVLQIRNGVALLQEASGKRPQYGNMVAFIPAHVPHRTEVVGRSAEYQSLYFNRVLFQKPAASIVIFHMSALGLSLLDHLNSEEAGQDMNHGIQKDCIELFVKVLARDVLADVRLIVLPDAKLDVNRALCRFIEENYHKKIGARDFSDVFPRSFRQLSRTFKSDTGLNIFEYLKIVRMLRASIHLNTTDTKIISVAYECGYDSISSFFTDFKRTFGLSPGQFRSRHK
ncbi:MAG: AraC family transcriptional regulator [Syntrophorhabdales bacterium]|jgi:AraC-like DNA-binding protein